MSAVSTSPAQSGTRLGSSEIRNPKSDISPDCSMAWFKREKTIAASEAGERHMRPEGLWLKCDSCKQIIWKKDIEGNQNVCPKCGAHWRIDAVERLKYLFDGDYELFDTDLTSSDPLRFVDSKPYQERLASMREATSLSDALISARGTGESRLG